MKKIFTLAAAVLASFSLWAVDPTYESSEWAKQADAEAALGAHNHVTLAQSGLSYGNLGSNGSFYYVAVGQNLKSSDSPWKYFSIVADENYLIDSVSVWYCENGSNETNVAWIGWGEGETPATKSLAHGETAGTKGSKKLADAKWVTIDAHTYDIQTMYLSRSIREFQDAEEKSISNFGKSQSFNILGFKVWLRKACTDPKAVLTLSKTSMFVKEEADLTFTTNSTGIWTSEVTLNGETAEPGTDYTMTGDPFSLPLAVKVIPLKAGTFEITMTQEAWDGYCAVEEKVTAEVSEANPVTAVTIDGPTAGVIGQELTYTATAEGATAYQWLVDGIDANTNAATFTYTAVKGNHSIVCSARNKFNATDEWIASDPISLKVTSLYGEIIKAELTSGSAATVTGLVGGTADVSLSSGKKMDKGKYFGITLASGEFQEGDTVVITMTTAGSNYPCLFADKERTNCLYLAEAASTELEYKIVLPAAATGLKSLYLARDANDATYKWNPVLASMAVVRPMPIKSSVETLTGVTINDVAIESSDLTKLVSTGEVILEDAYVNAPVVKFTKHTIITFEDESTKESDDVIEKTSSQATASTWGATATIGGNAYTVYTVKSKSYVVTYKFGEETLGSENVEANGSPANYATYQVLDDGGLSTFVAWYNDADLAEEHKVADIAAAVITEATTFYAKFDYKYSESINIEKWVMENGISKGKEDKTTELIKFMGTMKYAKSFAWESGNLELDSLDNSKSDKLRNYAYLGLKVKKSGSQFRVRLAPNSTVKIKFGAYKIGSEPTVSINGGEKAPITIENNVYSYTATGEDLLTFNMKTADAVVLQQIAINEELADPALFAINCAAVENGTLAAAYKLGIPGETVALTVTPAGGYVVASVSVNSDPIAADGEGKYSFEMPAAVANVAAVFSISTALGNTETEAKAVKVVENGMLIIKKDGKKYNIIGSVIR